jgi:flavin-dependent dehydrogenase
VPTDVVIVGAGPAGTIASLMLARAGVTVRLLDRARFPRDKLCGDTLNPGTLALLDSTGTGAAVRRAALPVTGMTVSGPNGATVVGEYPDGVVGAALSRRTLDQLLVTAAVSAGVVFDDGVRVIAAGSSDGGRVTRVAARYAGRECVYPSRLIIAADGRASRIGASLGLSAFARRPRRWAFGAYFDGVTGTTTHGEMHVRPNGYVGIAPLPGGIANVCCVRDLGDVSRGGDVLADAISRDEHLRRRFTRATRVSGISVLGPLAVDARGAGCPGLLLAGDAAGFVDPMTGDGLRFAVRGGMLAAEYALRELAIGVPQHAELHLARRREFAAKWRVNRALRALVASPRGVALAARASVHWSAPVRALITIAGDVQLAVGADAQQRDRHIA